MGYYCPAGSVQNEDEKYKCPATAFTADILDPVILAFNLENRQYYCPPESGEMKKAKGGYYTATDLPVHYITDNHGRVVNSYRIMTKQLPAMPGFYAALNAGLVACSIGKYTSLHKQTSCYFCDSGSESYKPTEATYCVPCNAGNYSNPQGGITKCTPCEAGQYSNFASKECSDCKAGWYSNTASSSTCTVCEFGKYQSISRSTTCILCPIGTFGNTTGLIECYESLIGYSTNTTYSGVTNQYPCPIGSYNNINRQPKCNLCPEGKYNNYLGASECIDCIEGKYSGIGGTICSLCGPNKYNNLNGSKSCSECQTIVNNNHTLCYPQIKCNPGEYSKYTNNGILCIPCNPGKYNSQPTVTICANCGNGFYTLSYNSSTCNTCNDPAISCNNENGLALVKHGYYGYIEINKVTNIMKPKTIQCPKNYCNGGYYLLYSNNNITQNISSYNINIQPCSLNRIQSVSNYLCGKCIDEYTEWRGECVMCDKVNVGLLIGFLVLSFTYVSVLHKLSQQSRGDIKILLYFIQSSLLQIGSLDKFLGWLGFFNFQPDQATNSNNCVLPLTNYQTLILSPIISCIFIGELLAILLLNYLFIKYNLKFILKWPFIIHVDINVVNNNSQLNPNNNQPFQRFDNEPHHNNVNNNNDNGNGNINAIANPNSAHPFYYPYIRTLIAIYLYSYMAISSTCLKYLQCIDVADELLVFSVPSISCRSDEYNSYKPIVITMLAINTALAPIIIAIALYKHKHLIHQVNGNNMVNGDNYKSSSAFKSKYGILYEAFNLNSHYYQSMILIRSIVLVTLSTFYIMLPHTLYASYTYFNFIVLLLHYIIQPYKRSIENKLESISLILLTFSSLTLLSMNDQDIKSAEIPPYIQIVLFCYIVPFVIFLTLTIAITRMWKFLSIQTQSHLLNRFSFLHFIVNINNSNQQNAAGIELSQVVNQ